LMTSSGVFWCNRFLSADLAGQLVQPSPWDWMDSI
jgi:hypothetical protein